MNKKTNEYYIFVLESHIYKKKRKNMILKNKKQINRNGILIRFFEELKKTLEEQTPKEAAKDDLNKKKDLSLTELIKKLVERLDFLECEENQIAMVKEIIKFLKIRREKKTNNDKKTVDDF